MDVCQLKELKKDSYFKKVLYLFVYKQKSRAKTRLFPVVVVNGLANLYRQTAHPIQRGCDD